MQDHSKVIKIINHIGNGWRLKQKSENLFLLLTHNIKNGPAYTQYLPFKKCSKKIIKLTKFLS